jgi:subtilase family serine protease
VSALAANARFPATNVLSLAIGLPLQNQPALEELLRQLYDPASTNFHKFLTPPEFTTRFGPSQEDYEAVIHFVERNGLVVVRRHPNRVVLDVVGRAKNIEQAFQVRLHTYKHPTEAREFFAPDVEPSVPTNVPAKEIWGLSDYAKPRPLSHKMDPVRMAPLNYNGTGPSGSYQGRDFRNAYAPGTALAGSGQIAAVAEFDGYYANDITTYEAHCGYTNVPLQNVLLNNVTGTPGYSGVANAVAEVSLDIELIIAMAPGLSKVIVYEGSNPYSVFSQIATDNTAKQISCSWSWSKGPTFQWAHPGNFR